jgi:hypothetical protein
MSGWQFCGAESVLENLAVNKLIEGRNGRRWEWRLFKDRVSGTFYEQTESSLKPHFLFY